jgi:hypothetical protein
MPECYALYARIHSQPNKRIYWRDIDTVGVFTFPKFEGALAEQELLASRLYALVLSKNIFESGNDLNLDSELEIADINAREYLHYCLLLLVCMDRRYPQLFLDLCANCSEAFAARKYAGIQPG